MARTACRRPQAGNSMASKYTFHFADNTKIVQERRGGESDRHIVLKLLGYMLYFGLRPQIEVAISDDRRAYRPDVVAFDAAGNITLWIDCGQITMRKVDDLARRYDNAALVVIKTTFREVEGYAVQAMKKVRHTERVLFVGFDADFVPSLIAALGHNNQIAFVRDGARLCVTLNGADYFTTVWRWDAALARAAPYDPPPEDFTRTAQVPL